MSGVRKPPVRAVYAQHQPREKGKCPWCGLPCEERTPVRKLLRERHYDCAIEEQIITQPGVARWALFRRDHGVCIDCGMDCSELSRFVPEFRDKETGQPRTFRAYDGRGRDVVQVEYTPLTVISLWHADHDVPLWKVKHLPDLQRIEYFKLKNLVTRCEDCHLLKSKGEASERAHLDRLAGETVVELPKRTWPSREFPKRETTWPSRKLESRPFPKRRT